MLILDLDDTIFPTSSMNPRLFDNATQVVVDFYEELGSPHTKDIVKELWNRPSDQVLARYNAPTAIINRFYKAISSISFETLNIKPFDDYVKLLEIPQNKVLVTTGLKELQNAKK